MLEKKTKEYSFSSAFPKKKMKRRLFSGALKKNTKKNILILFAGFSILSELGTVVLSQ